MKFFIYILTLFLASISTAQVNPYEAVSLMPKGSTEFEGRAIDTEKFRPAFITSDLEGEAFTFENYLHDDRFWGASLPNEVLVESVYVHVVRFEVVSGITAAHVQLRFKLSKGSEATLTSGDEIIKRNDIIVSFEAGRPKDVAYNFFTGMQDNYVLVGRVASDLQRLSEYDENYRTEQYELSLGMDERKKLLFDALKRSHEGGFSQFYNTLKLNCTTEVFDLIDALPSIKRSSPEPFLTVLSNDPVAGPTIEALRDRGVLKGRAANLRAEVERGEVNPPSEDVVSPDVELLPSIEGYPYSIVMLAPADLKDNPGFVEAKRAAYELAPKFLQTFISNLMMSTNGKSDGLLKSLRDMGKLMKERLSFINGHLLEEGGSFSLYLTPWSQDQGVEVDVMKELGLDVRLPFSTFEADQENLKYVNEIHAGLNDALRAHAASTTSFGVMGLVVQVSLVKEDVSMTVQVVGHLGDAQKEMMVSNEKVNIDEFIVPERNSILNQPVAILDLTQKLYDEAPSLNLLFGGFDGVQSDDLSKFGQFKINDRVSARRRARSTPSLRGSVASFGLIDVWMDIFSIEFDLEKLLVGDMDVRLTSGIFDFKTGILKRTYSDHEVNSQFVDAVNDQVASSPGLALFEQIFSNNPDGMVSGFKVKSQSSEKVNTGKCKNLL